MGRQVKAKTVQLSRRPVSIGGGLTPLAVENAVYRRFNGILSTDEDVTKFTRHPIASELMQPGNRAKKNRILLNKKTPGSSKGCAEHLTAKSTSTHPPIMKFLIPLLAAVSAFTVMTPTSVEARERCSSGHHRSHSHSQRSHSYRSHSHHGGHHRSYSRSHYSSPSRYYGGSYYGGRPYRCEPYIRPYCPPRPNYGYYGGYNGGSYGGHGFSFYYSR